MIGFSYYAAMGMHDGRLAIHPPDAPISPLGYGIWADGVGLVLDRLHAELPGAPLPVAEYGIGTDDDDLRADYLQRGLTVVHEAIERGIDVRGNFHWTAVDNYEWLHGYDVSFGIMDAIAMCDRVPESFSKRRNHAEPAPLPDYAAIPLMSPVWPAPSRQIPTSTALR